MCIQPSITAFLCFLGPLPIAHHHDIAAHDDFADRARRNRLIGDVDDPYVDHQARASTRSVAPLGACLADMNWMVVLGVAIVILFIFHSWKKSKSHTQQARFKTGHCVGVGKNIQRAELLRRLFRSARATQGVMGENPPKIDTHQYRPVMVDVWWLG